MKEKTKQIVSCVIFGILLVIAITGCADFLEKKDARIKFTEFYESETNFDVVFFGTSHMYYAILPMEMWDRYGVASYNWGFSNCTPAESYYMVKEVLSQTNPEVIVIDIYGIVEYEKWNNGKYRTDRIEQQHVLFDEMPLSKNKVEAALDIFDDYEDNEDFIWNFSMYHNRWSELGEEDFNYEITSEKGGKFLVGLGDVKYYPKEKVKKLDSIDTVCYDYFIKTLEYCEENGVKVLAVYLPPAVNYKGQQVAKTIEDIIKDYPNCEYVNVVDEQVIDYSTDLNTDKTHLNYSGALKATEWLGQYLVKQYELDNYEDNEYWRADYDNYYNYKVKNIKEQTEIENYLILLTDTDFEASLLVFNPEILEYDRLMKLAENANVTVEYVPDVTAYDTSLTITSTYTNEVVETVWFTYSGQKSEGLPVLKE